MYRGHRVRKLSHAVLPVLRLVARQAGSTHFCPLPLRYDNKRTGAYSLTTTRVHNTTRVGNTKGIAGVDVTAPKPIAIASAPIPDHLNSLARLRLRSSRQADQGYLLSVEARLSLVVAINRLREWTGSEDVTIACLCQANMGNNNVGNVNGGNVTGGNVSAINGGGVNVVIGSNGNGSNVDVSTNSRASFDGQSIDTDTRPIPPPPPPLPPVYMTSPSAPFRPPFRNRTDSAASVASTGTINPTPPCYDTRFVCTLTRTTLLTLPLTHTHHDKHIREVYIRIHNSTPTLSPAPTLALVTLRRPIG